VLYVQVPADLKGGELLLRQGKRQVGRVVPQVNKLVRFQGDLSHEVSAVAPNVTGRRMSLVCEQYQLEAKVLGEIPTFLVEGRR
jgi:Rps23 Pro-64 3,4-dihydroxylase Tpa1-like proline 4-hydroxylase